MVVGSEEGDRGPACVSRWKRPISSGGFDSHWGPLCDRVACPSPVIPSRSEGGRSVIVYTTTMGLLWMNAQVLRE